MEYNLQWGGLGGGAPNQKIRRRNILIDELFPSEATNDCRQYIFETPFHTRRGGGGAPLRNAAGKILTTYREDASITFQEPTRSYVDNHLRYKKSAEGKRKYKMELDECISTKDRMNGKIPWRKSKAAGKSFMKSMGWTDETLMKTLDSHNENSVPPEVFDKQNKYQSNANQAKLKIPSQCCANCFCDCKARYAIAQANKDSMLSQPPSSYVGSSKDIRKPKYVKPRDCMITGGVELVPLLAKRRAMQRPISLSTTDITREPTERSKCQWDNEKLLDFLCCQISQKERRTQMNRDYEVESTKRHFQTVESFWGRPGHGAPLKVKTKYNLNDLLYRTWT